MTTVGVLDKCVAILELVRVKPSTASELSRHTNMPMSTTHRLLKALARHNMVTPLEGGTYGVGSFFALYSRDASQKILRQLSDATKESAQLWARRGPWRVCLLSVDAEHELRVSESVGAKIRLIDGGSAADALRAEDPDSRVFSSEQARAANVGSSSVALHLNNGWRLAVCVSYPLARAPASPQEIFKQVLIEAADRLKLSLADSPNLSEFERIIADSLGRTRYTASP